MFQINHTIREINLPNRSKLIGIEAPHLPYSVIAAGFRVGSRFDPLGKAGCTHLLEHVYMCRTNDFLSKGKRFACLESMGIAFNAVTRQESVLFYQSQLSDYLMQSLELFWNGLTDSKITLKDVELEKKIIADERLIDATDPYNIVLNEAMRLLWPKSNLSSPIVGTEKSIMKLQVKDVRNLYKKSFSPEQATYFAIGNKNELNMAREFFIKKLSTIEVKKTKIEKVTHQQTHVNTTFDSITLCKSKDSNKNFAIVGIYFKTDSIFNQRDRINLSFIKAYFVGSWIGRLIELLRIKNNMTYWIDDDSDYFSDSGYIGFQFSVAPNSVKNAIDLVLREFARLKRVTISSHDMVPHKTSLISSVVKTSNDPEYILSWYCQEPIARADSLSMPMFISSISSLTGKEIQKAARSYFIKKNIAIVIDGADSLVLKKQINTLIDKL